MVVATDTSSRSSVDESRIVDLDEGTIDLLHAEVVPAVSLDLIDAFRQSHVVSYRSCQVFRRNVFDLSVVGPQFGGMRQAGDLSHLLVLVDHEASPIGLCPKSALLALLGM